MLCVELKEWDGGGREAQGKGGVCIHRADSLCSIAETNTTLKRDCTPINRNYWHLEAGVRGKGCYWSRNRLSGPDVQHGDYSYMKVLFTWDLLQE